MTRITHRIRRALHVLVAPRPRGKHAGPARRVRRATAAGIGVLALTGGVLLLNPATGTYALWNASAEIPDATITTGTLGLSIALGTQPGAPGQTSAAIPASTWATMLPGDTVGTPVTLTNTGDTLIGITAVLDATSAADPDVDFRFTHGSCPAGIAPGPPLTTVPTPVDAMFLSGSYTEYCLQATLSPTTPANRQGTQLVPAFSLTLTATQEV